MTQSTDGNRPTPPAAHDEEAAAAERTDPGHIAPGHTDPAPIDGPPIDPRERDPLDGITVELDGLADLDPADAVPVLAEITAELNKELDADTDRS